MSALEVMKYINPISIMDRCVSFIGFKSIHTILNLKMERNMSNNFTSLFHACGRLNLSWFNGNSVFRNIKKLCRA